MTSAVTYHPSPEMLSGFAKGSLSTGLSVAISAHVELCAQCRERTSALETEATLEWLQDPARDAVGDRDFSHMIDAIVSQAQQADDVEETESSVQEIHMLEGSVTLPRILAKLASEGLVWRKMAGGINQAAVALDDETQCEFLYMKPGSQVPVHKHKGNEITLVLDGSFSDESGRYEASDFVSRDSRHQHQPVSEEGCLCFYVLDNPLVFTSGLARLLNPLIQYQFKRATSRA
ncbi:MAG: ChrR family anti-sigma-E factor [Pseudohongiellaceae bacterium]|jgi:putative transcriptional regulator